MMRFHCMLATRFPATIEADETAFLKNLLIIGEWLGVRITLASPGRRDRRFQERVNGRGCEVMSEILPFESPMRFTRQILALAERCHADLLALPLERSLELGQYGIRISRAVRYLLEQSPIPTLLVPEERELNIPPFGSILVPVSGEKRQSLALELGIRLANAHHLAVDLVHVTKPSLPCACPDSYLEATSDSLGHEYPALVDALLASALPYMARKDRACIRAFFHRSGEICPELTDVMHQGQDHLVIMDWKGRLSPGRAKILKSVLKEADVPVLLARETPPHVSTLKVGNRFF